MKNTFWGIIASVMLITFVMSEVKRCRLDKYYIELLIPCEYGALKPEEQFSKAFRENITALRYAYFDDIVEIKKDMERDGYDQREIREIEQKAVDAANEKCRHPYGT